MSVLVALEIMITITFFVAIASAALFYVSVFWSLFSDAPFVALPRHTAEKMVELSGIKSGDRVVDLGSGHGQIVFAAVRHGARVEGYELSPFLVFITRLRKFLFYPRSDVKIYKKDFFESDLRHIDVVFCYLFTEAMNRLKDKFELELRHGSLVVSARFHIEEWVPKETVVVGKVKIYLYEVK